MVGNIAGLVWSFVLVLFCAGLGLLINKKSSSDFGDELARKIVHIGVSNWFFIYRAFFDFWLYPVAVLLFFTVANYYQERKSAKRWGTVYYPISIIIMIFLKELGFGSVVSLGCGLLTMGYADGLGALIGLKFGKWKMPFSRSKSVLGSLFVFAISVVVIICMSSISWGWVLVIGIVCMFVETYTPFGLDNFTLPLVTYILCSVLC